MFASANYQQLLYSFACTLSVSNVGTLKPFFMYSQLSMSTVLTWVNYSTRCPRQRYELFSLTCSLNHHMLPFAIAKIPEHNIGNWFHTLELWQEQQASYHASSRLGTTIKTCGSLRPSVVLSWTTCMAASNTFVCTCSRKRPSIKQRPHRSPVKTSLPRRVRPSPKPKLRVQKRMGEPRARSQGRRKTRMNPRRASQLLCFSVKPTEKRSVQSKTAKAVPH